MTITLTDQQSALTPRVDHCSSTANSNSPQFAVIQYLLSEKFKKHSRSIHPGKNFRCSCTSWLTHIYCMFTTTTTTTTDHHEKDTISLCERGPFRPDALPLSPHFHVSNLELSFFALIFITLNFPPQHTATSFPPSGKECATMAWAWRTLTGVRRRTNRSASPPCWWPTGGGRGRGPPGPSLPGSSFAPLPPATPFPFACTSLR